MHFELYRLLVLHCILNNIKEFLLQNNNFNFITHQKFKIGSIVDDWLNMII